MRRVEAPLPANLMITEPDVALTDYGLAIECALFAYLFYVKGEGHRRRRIWFTVFFGSTGAASLLGGTVHGFFLDVNTTGSTIFWPATLIAIGAAAMAAWAIAATTLRSRPLVNWITLLAGVEFVVYCFVILFVTDNFVFAVINYLPPALFLFLTLFLLYRRTQEFEVALGVVGMGLTFIASWVQQKGFALHPVYFNHNAFYHLIDAAALFLIFLAARSMVATSTNEGGEPC